MDATTKGWTICSFVSSLRLASPLRFATSCLPVLTRSVAPIDCADHFLPHHLFAKLQSICDNATEIAFRLGGNRPIAHHFRPSVFDIRLHFFHRLLFSLVKRKTNAAHFDTENEAGTFSLMPKSRFEYLNSNLVYSYDHFLQSKDAKDEIDSFYELCRMIMWSLWRPASNLAYDELILPFQGSSKLVTHIPRKPHNTGLLLYLLGIETQNEDAVIVDFFPIDRDPKVPGLDSFISMLDKVADMDAFKTTRPHFYVDALFGGTESVARGSAKDCYVTASVGDNSERSLINLLTFDLALKKYRVAHRQLFKNWYSTFLTYSDNAVLNVCSNAVYCSDDFEHPSSSSASDISSSSSISSAVASSATVSTVSNTSSTTTAFIDGPKENGNNLTIGLTLEESIGFASFGDQFPRGLRLISQRCGMKPEDSGGAPLNLVSQLTGFGIEDLTRKRGRTDTETLEKTSYDGLTVKVLVAMLKERRLNATGTRDILIKRLVWNDNSAKKGPTEEILDFVGPSHQGPPTSVPLYTQYLEHFNYIDKFNRNFYFIRFPHRETCTVHIFIWSLLNILFINSWAAYRDITSNRKISLEDYARSCIHSVLNEKGFYGKDLEEDE